MERLTAAVAKIDPSWSWVEDGSSAGFVSKTADPLPRGFSYLRSRASHPSARSILNDSDRRSDRSDASDDSIVGRMLHAVRSVMRPSDGCWLSDETFDDISAAEQAAGTATAIVYP